MRDHLEHLARHIEGLDSESRDAKAILWALSELNKLGANPAEAATRENDEAVLSAAARIMDAAKYEAAFGENANWLAVQQLAIHELHDISTHQQQGGENELVERLRECAEQRGWPHAELLNDAADALSRAPQPDNDPIGFSRVINLSPDDFEAFDAALSEPPPPNDKLRELLRGYTVISQAAPQPDTVTEPTEEMVWAAFDALHTGIAANDFTKDLAKRIITAALAATWK